MSRSVLMLVLVALLAGCAAPASAKVNQVPEAVDSSLNAAEQGDLNGFLDSFALEAGSEDRHLNEVEYRIWLADLATADWVAWSIVQVQSRPEGGQAVDAQITAIFDAGDETLSLKFVTNASGKIVNLTVTREATSADAQPPSHR